MSHSKEMTELVIPHTTLNLLRNDLMKFKCGPLVYRTIIHWGFALPKDKKIKDHIKDLKIGERIEKKNFPKWLKDNESKLNLDSFSDFDITALHDFIPILCYDKIAQTGGGKEYDEKINDPNSVESLLKKIKAFRNDVSHEFTKAMKDSYINEMKDTMRKCIRAAGNLYDKDQSEIESKVKLLDNEFDEVLLNTTHYYENRVKYIAQKISSEVPSNMLEIYSPYFSVPLPGSWTKKYTSDIFQCSNLSVTTEDKKGNPEYNRNIFPCTEIYNNTNDKFVVINGRPGSGKTTLKRNMCHEILQTSVLGSRPKYEKIEQFKIPIYLECRSEQQTNLAKFLKEYLKNFLHSEDDIYEAFKTVEGLVFLIDGYDEINNNCRQLVDSIIDFCRDYKASCIVSSRVDAGYNFVNKLQRKNLKCTIMFIEPISELSDQVNFLKSYADKMDGSINTKKLVNSFKNLTAAAKEIFSSPILLALFISLFVHDPDSESEMKNEHSAYEAVRTSFLREMEDKLENVHNPKGRAADVANVLCKFCLKFFNAKKYYLDETEYLKMVAECEKLENMSKVNIPNLLSCILIPEHSFKFSHTSYQFMHSTIQEFFAAKYVSENIREFLDDLSSESQSEDRQLPTLLHALELNETQSDIEEEMKRYGNIIKLLILEILSNGELLKYRSTFTELLKKYFKPKDYYPDYHLDFILSSDNNADIISIMSDCMRGYKRLNLKYHKHIKPMIKMMQQMKTGIKINFSSYEVANTHQIIKLLAVLGDDSEIGVRLHHSYDNYQPLEERFYIQLKNSKCKITRFTACISSEEHLSIAVRVHRGNRLDISSPSVSDFSFAALEEFRGYLVLKVKYTVGCFSTMSNPIRAGTDLRIEHIPADGKEQLYSILKNLGAKHFLRLHLDHCHLTDTDANELLNQLHREKIRTGWGTRTEVEEKRLHKDKSRHLELHLVESEEEE